VRQHSLQVLAVLLIAIVALALAHVILTDTFHREAPDSFRVLVVIVEVVIAGLLAAAAATHLLSVARERSRHAVVESLAEAFSVPRSIEEIGQISVAQLVGSDVGGAALLAVAREDGQQLEAIAACGYPPRWEPTMRPADELIPQETVVRRELNLIDPWLEPVEARLGQQPWVARVPIVSGDEVLGLLLLVNPRQGLLGDMRLLRVVSTLIAAALDHAQLYVAAYGPPSAADADLARHQLLQALASEIRPALVTVEAHASVVAGEDHAPDTIEDARHLSSLSRSLERLNTVLDDLTTLGGQGAPAAAGAPAPPTDVSAVLRESSEVFAPAFEAHDQTLHLELPEEPLTALVTAEAVERMMLHLLSNANRSAPPGGSVTLRASDAGGTIRIEVADSGPALDPLERNHVFEPFYRVGPGISEVPGAGLGLAVAARLAESAGGIAWAEAGAAGGASYYIDLPALIRSTAEPPEPERAAAPGDTADAEEALAALPAAGDLDAPDTATEVAFRESEAPKSSDTESSETEPSEAEFPEAAPSEAGPDADLPTEGSEFDTAEVQLPDSGAGAHDTVSGTEEHEGADREASGSLGDEDQQDVAYRSEYDLLDLKDEPAAVGAGDGADDSVSGNDGVAGDEVLEPASDAEPVEHAAATTDDGAMGDDERGEPRS